MNYLFTIYPFLKNILFINMQRYILNTILLILLIIFISLTRPCNSSLFSKPLWPCPYNSRLKHLYINESDGKYTSQSLFDIYSFTHIITE